MLTDDTSSAIDLPFPLIDAHVDAIKVIVRDEIKDPTNQVATILAIELERQVGVFLEKSTAA